MRKELRSEVGFGCPVPGCSVPYLEYHHFDPPWHIENHHRPEGMIALCSVHHAKADAWTIEQVRHLKLKAVDPNRRVAGRFEWMRGQVLAIAGGNYYLDCPVILELNETAVIWYNRDDDGHALLNVRLPTGEGGWSHLLDDNDWRVEGQPVDVISPPSGHELGLQYADGTTLNVKFREWKSPVDFFAMHTPMVALAKHLHFPLVTAAVNIHIPRWKIRLREKASAFETLTMTNNVSFGCGVGVSMHGGPPIIPAFSEILKNHRHLFSDS
ncbi:hypothetical protein ACIPUB_09930 [Paeniglutamicibacter sp. ORCA_105]|uniref:hypothetical protein n=1 Tax=Paeniglutamicibacter sp. ORCA_105 TaxID=3377336 RepID=UPI003892F7EF